jgi:transposase-like protein
MGQGRESGLANVDLAPLVSEFGSEPKCRAYLENLRWPRGVHCPRCAAKRGISWLEGRGQFDCDTCGYQFSVRVGTIFHDSHLPLWKWFLAAYAISESKSGVTASQLKRMLAVSYKTAWHLSQRIRSVIDDDDPGFRGMLVRLLETNTRPYTQMVAERGRVDSASGA